MLATTVYTWIYSKIASGPIISKLETGDIHDLPPILR
jgi:hypothetical protein